MFQKLTSFLRHQMAFWKGSCYKLSVNEPETEIKFLLKHSWVWKWGKKHMEDGSLFCSASCSWLPLRMPAELWGELGWLSLASGVPAVRGLLSSWGGAAEVTWWEKCSLQVLFRQSSSLGTSNWHLSPLVNSLKIKPTPDKWQGKCH